jgi:FKBP-type peptidyl-prolyl cis-trans isomerase (trigger factor)
LNNQSEDDLREEWQERAESRLERGLIIHQFITNEKLRIEDADLDAAVEKQLARFDNEQTIAYMRDWLTGEAGRNMLGNDILMDKIYDRIVAIYQGEAPDLAELESEEEEE